MFDRLVSGWSPYGLEPARRKALRVRLLKAIVAVIVVYLTYAGYLALTTKEEQSVRQFGGDDPNAAGRGKSDAELNPPIRVSLTPGKASFSNLQDDGGVIGVPGPRPMPSPGIALNWLNVFKLLGTYAGIYALFAKVARSGIHAQVNFGVYKGSMPYELHGQSIKKRIFSHKMAKFSVPLVRKSEYYARIAPDFPSLFWKRMLEGDPLQAEVMQVHQVGRPVGKVARPV